MEVEVSKALKAPFPWFGGKSRVASLVWERFGFVDTYNEPFAGSLAVLLGRPHEPRIETVNDLDCVAPRTQILRGDLTWACADRIKVGEKLVGFDEQNMGTARLGCRAPTKYRRLALATVTGIRTLRKPCYRLKFDDGTEVVASANHLWLGGSHKSGGRGWRWIQTRNMVCNRKTQRSWVLKVADVTYREESHEAGWLGGLFDGEGHLHAGPGLRVVVSQNEGLILERATDILRQFGYSGDPGGKRRCKTIQVNGGIASTLSLLMRIRPERLIRKLSTRLQHLSLYGRKHRAVGLVSKEFLGEQTVVAIETDCKTFIAEGLASHNCYLANFWRALQADPDGVAKYADSPVNEADLHSRHRWLVEVARKNAERCMTEPDFYDAKIAGWWVWGQCLWIGSGWCNSPNIKKFGQSELKNNGVGINRETVRVADNQKRPSICGNGESSGVHRKRFAGTGNGQGAGVNRRWQGGGAGGGSGVIAPSLTRQLPQLSGDGSGAQRGLLREGVKSIGLYEYLNQLAQRLRRVRVCCGDWNRVLTPSVTTYIGMTGVFLDPPYKQDMRERCYSEDHDISADVAKWAIENGDNPKMRIALCGYEGEHVIPPTWECVAWKAHGGYSRSERGKANRARERIWFSPACLQAYQGELI